MNNVAKKKAVIIGAGPAGLTAGDQLLKSNYFNVDILEKETVEGGLSRTTEFKGCKFDIGPHHFITESAQIEQYWKDVMQDEELRGNYFVKLKRFTRIYYKKHFFYYPLRPLNAIFGLSFFECIRCILSYIKICIFPIKKVETFQDWVTNKFGYRLFSIYFKTYTEKLWGIPCTQISCDWASERIKGFSLYKAIFYAFLGRWFKKNAPRTISDEFYYPLLGAGTLWKRMATKLKSSQGCKIHLDRNVLSLKHENFKVVSVSTINTELNEINEFPSDYFLSTMPLKNLILAMDPLPETEIVQAAKNLCYRGLITVNLIVNKKDISPDHWLYIHEKEVFMVRIGNMNNFSLKMVDIAEHTALSLEYFTFTNGEMWNYSDEQLINLGKKELEQIGFVAARDVLNGMVLKEEHAYPIYVGDYKKDLNIVLNFLSKFSNLQLMGRNGLHQYNNMDIAMLSAIKAVKNVLQQVEKEKELYFDANKYNEKRLDA